MAMRDRYAGRKNAGAIGSLMRSRVREHTKHLSDRTRRNYLLACKNFDAWRKAQGYSNKVISRSPQLFVEQWRDALGAENYSAGTIHTYIAGVCCGLGVSMTGIAKSGTAANKRKSLGGCDRSRKALERPENVEIVAFQRMVGGRRAALQRLTGSDFIQDESGQWCVRFTRDKGGKSQLQRIAPEDVKMVKAYFDVVAAGEKLFPEKIDRNLDLHGLDRKSVV